MAQFANMFEVNLDNRSYPVSLVQTVSEGNVYSNRIGAYVYKDGAPVNLGGACTGLVMRADGTTVPLTGYVEGNAAYVVLDQPSCAIPGPIQVAVNSVVGENITTLLVAYGTVILTDTRNYVEPGTPIPDITALLAEIENMREATEAAEAAATKAVRYDTAQSLTNAQKQQARDNISAADDTLWDALIGDVQEIVWENNYQTILPDANGAVQNKIYRIAYDLNATNIPANLPITRWVSTKPALLVTIQKLNTSIQKVQIYLDTQGLYIRNYTSIWQDWVLALDNSNNRTGIVESFGTTITDTSIISDLNDIKTNSVYRFNFLIGATSIPANVPTGSAWKARNGATLITTVNKSSYVGSTQIFICSEGIWCRVHGSVDWNRWISAAEHEYTVVVDKAGYGDYTSLTQAIMDYQGVPNVKMYVLPGEYDIISEVGLIYGQDYLENLTESWIGPNILSNRIHIVFSEGALVKCVYLGSNTYVHQRFSPFNAGEYGFTLENLRIICRNIRYCVHDERMTSGDSYENYYLNCEMYKDNTLNPDLDIVQCIGGGLGKHGQIVIKDCIFDNGAASGHWVSYHNSAASDARSKIVVSGNYFSKGGTVRFAHYGDSTDRTQCVVSNNSLGSDIEIAYETSDYHVENMQVTAWNNEIRN